MKVYPLRIAPILTIFTQNESSWRDLSFETHFVFRWFFSRRAVDGCSVDGRRMIFGRPFSHDKIRWISKIQISNFKFQISNFNWPGLGPVRAVPSVRAVPPQPWPIEIWNFTKNKLKKTGTLKEKKEKRNENENDKKHIFSIDNF